ncbi:hypothetical protein C5749_05280 [Sphingobacterium gobiense]|uniref:Uncharacterized protein n=1 Tax=Sphingobacterium gobiense TaxID=1382456 RepID=A0A2S9JTN3_9SPHI|nr:hypothetical protein C5749_05280 [Sphingobacterium gobiense]
MSVPRCGNVVITCAIGAKFIDTVGFNICMLKLKLIYLRCKPNEIQIPIFNKILLGNKKTP